MVINVFALSAFFDVCKLQEIFPFLAKIYFQKLLILVSILGVIIDPTVKRSLIEKLGTPQTKILLVFNFWMLLSLPFSVFPGNSIYFFTESYWKNIVVYILITAYGNNYKKLYKIIIAYILGTIVLSVLYIAAQSSGRIDLIDSYDANELALVLVVFFPFTFYYSLKEIGYKRIVGLLGCCIILTALIKTDSRGGFLGFLSTVIVILFQLRKINRKYFIGGIITVTLIGTVFFFIADKSYLDRLSTIINYEKDYNTTSETGRIKIWKRGIAMMFENPILGVGPNNFLYAEGQMHYYEGGKWSAAHNAYVQVGAELGIPGLFLFCMIIYKSMVKLRFKKNNKESNIDDYKITILYNSIFAGYIGFIVSGTFLSVAYDLLLLQLLGLTTCALSLLPERT